MSAGSALRRRALFFIRALIVYFVSIVVTLHVPQSTCSANVVAVLAGRAHRCPAVNADVRVAALAPTGVTGLEKSEKSRVRDDRPSRLYSAPRCFILPHC